MDNYSEIERMLQSFAASTLDKINALHGELISMNNRLQKMENRCDAMETNKKEREEEIEKMEAKSIVLPDLEINQQVNIFTNGSHDLQQERK